MERISAIANLIDSSKNVIDVGCDHAYLAINLLSNHKADLVVNIDINEKPLQQGIKNLSTHGLLDKTINLKNDGLKGLENNESVNINYDFLVISGLGSNVIIDILSNNKLNIKNLILQTNKNELLLRTWLLENKYKIIKELYICENGISYSIFHVLKTRFKLFWTYEQRFLAKKSTIVNIDEYQKYLLFKQQHIEGENINAQLKHANNLKIIKKRINWCQRKLIGIKNANTFTNR